MGVDWCSVLHTQTKGNILVILYFSNFQGSGRDIFKNSIFIPVHSIHKTVYEFFLRISSEREFINKYMYVYILKLYSQQHILFSQQGIPHMQIRVAKVHILIFLKYNKNKYSVQLFWESWQYDHHCQEKYIISGRFNRKECYPPECGGGAGGGGINPFSIL